jgi:hypothetical protein
LGGKLTFGAQVGAAPDGVVRRRSLAIDVIAIGCSWSSPVQRSSVVNRPIFECHLRDERRCPLFKWFKRAILLSTIPGIWRKSVGG